MIAFHSDHVLSANVRRSSVVEASSPRFVNVQAGAARSVRSSSRAMRRMSSSVSGRTMSCRNSFIMHSDGISAAMRFSGPCSSSTRPPSGALRRENRRSFPFQALGWTHIPPSDRASSTGISPEITVSSSGNRRCQFRICVVLPVPDGAGALPVVRFPGIAHVIRECAPVKGEAEDLARAWCEALGADALWILFYEAGEEQLTPLVYVPAAGTTVWERILRRSAAVLELSGR